MTYDLKNPADQGAHSRDKGLTLPNRKVLGNDDFYEDTDQLDVFGNATVTMYAYTDEGHKHGDQQVLNAGTHNLDTMNWYNGRKWRGEIESIEFQTLCPKADPPHKILPGASPTEGYDCNASSGTVNVYEGG